MCGILILSVVPRKSGWHGMILHMILPVLCTVMILLDDSNCFLRSSPMRWIGSYSFTLYLWHWPCLVFSCIYLDNGRFTINSESVILGYSCATVFGILTTWIIERPLRKAWFASKPAFAVIPMILILLTQVCVYTLANSKHVSASLKNHLPGSREALDLYAWKKRLAVSVNEFDQNLVILNISAIAPSFHNPSFGWSQDVELAGCVDKMCEFPLIDSAGFAFLYGDSHAGQWIKSVLLTTRKLNFTLRVYMGHNCPGQVYQIPLCLKVSQQFDLDVLNLRPKLIILSRSLHHHLNDNMLNMLPWLSNLSKQSTILWMEDAIHSVSRNDVSCLESNPKNAKICMTRREEHLDRLSTIDRSLVAQSNCSFIETLDLICLNFTCPLVVDNLLLFFDNNHLTEPFLSTVVQIVSNRILNAYHNWQLMINPVDIH